ncbi:hypothetical protein BaRGS_00015548 [Batillaria attramentaria]|uniref:Uncharacterized protein n=1 Tax=Batillaria attramentaria TaxID=370345 RepID=A0ABD0L158_9CAEN
MQSADSFCPLCRCEQNEIHVVNPTIRAKCTTPQNKSATLLPTQVYSETFFSRKQLLHKTVWKAQLRTASVCLAISFT